MLSDAVEELKHLMKSPTCTRNGEELEIRDEEGRVIRVRDGVQDGHQVMNLSFEDVEPAIADAFVAMIQRMYEEMTGGTDKLVISE